MNTNTPDRLVAYSESLANAAMFLMLFSIAVTAIALGYTLNQFHSHR